MAVKASFCKVISPLICDPEHLLNSRKYWLRLPKGMTDRSPICFSFASVGSNLLLIGVA